MPLFMDVHHLDDSLDSQHVAEDHAADLRFQGNHNVRYLRYWVDRTHGTLFHLVEAPYAEAAKAVHREAGNLVTDEIYPVEEGTGDLTAFRTSHHQPTSNTHPRS